MNEKQREEMANAIMLLENMKIAPSAKFEIIYDNHHETTHYIGNREGVRLMVIELLKSTIAQPNNKDIYFDELMVEADDEVEAWVINTQLDDNWKPGKVYHTDQEETTMDKLLPYGCFIVVAFLAITFIAGLIKLSELIF